MAVAPSHTSHLSVASSHSVSGSDVTATCTVHTNHTRVIEGSGLDLLTTLIFFRDAVEADCLTSTPLFPSIIQEALDECESLGTLLYLLLKLLLVEHVCNVCAYICVCVYDCI